MDSLKADHHEHSSAAALDRMLLRDAFDAFSFSFHQRECGTATVVLLECVIPPAAGTMMRCPCGDAAGAVLSMSDFPVVRCYCKVN